MCKKTIYPNINVPETGLLLKEIAVKHGYSVKQIQEYLELSCPQPIYRWYHGKVLPSVDHLYSLSCLYNMHMEELLVTNQRHNLEKEDILCIKCACEQYMIRETL